MKTDARPHFISLHLIERGIQDVIVGLGYELDNPAIKDTPKRVARAYEELCRGYNVDVSTLFTVFEEPCDEMVICRDVEFYSLCEHHLLPFTGRAHVGYIPTTKVIGLSKLARIVDVYSQRLQIQERIGQQVTGALMQFLQPLGAACVIEAEHFCMKCRGVRKQNSKMITSSMLGAFRDRPEVRAEFMSLIKG